MAKKLLEENSIEQEKPDKVWKLGKNYKKNRKPYYASSY